MNGTRSSARLSKVKKENQKEAIKILTNFFNKSNALIENSLKEARGKYPDLFKTPFTFQDLEITQTCKE